MDARPPVEVTPLGWSSTWPTGSDRLQRADTIVGTYRVWTHHKAGGVWFWELSGANRETGENVSEVAAKSGAFADYEKRVLSAIWRVDQRANIENLLEVARATVAAMSPEERAAMHRSQAESFARGLSAKCEHGFVDFEQCAECRQVARDRMSRSKPNTEKSCT